MDVSLRSRVEQLAKDCAGQVETAEELNGLMQLMVKSALERMLNTEMDVHLGRKRLTVTAEAEPSLIEASGALDPAAPPADPGKRGPNRRNGRSQKTVQGEQGEITLVTPRDHLDRHGTFEPQVIG